jgi:diacylglycerol kinase (ATP)
MSINKPSNEIARLLKAFVYSAHGLKAALLQPAFRIEVLTACVLIPGAFMFSQNALECALLVGSVLLVLIVELLNTAVEMTIDRISSEWHELSKRAKDLGSAAVFLSFLNATTIWLIIFIR